jgi:hypothetical protein
MSIGVTAKAPAAPRVYILVMLAVVFDSRTTSMKPTSSPAPTQDRTEEEDQTRRVDHGKI